MTKDRQDPATKIAKIRRPSPKIRRPSPKIRRPSPKIRRPSPKIRRPSPKNRRPKHPAPICPAAPSHPANLRHRVAMGMVAPSRCRTVARTRHRTMQLPPPRVEAVPGIPVPPPVIAAVPGGAGAVAGLPLAGGTGSAAGIPLAGAAAVPLAPITLPVVVGPSIGLGGAVAPGAPTRPTLPGAPRPDTTGPPAGREPLPANVDSNVAVPASFRVGYGRILASRRTVAAGGLGGARGRGHPGTHRCGGIRGIPPGQGRTYRSHRWCRSVYGLEQLPASAGAGIV